MKTEIEIQVSIVQPLQGVAYALQSGKGKNFELVQGPKLSRFLYIGIGTDKKLLAEQISRMTAMQ